MSKGIAVVDNEFQILNGTRVVFTTEGTLVELLPTLEEFSDKTVDFPEPPKDYIYAWRGKDDRGFNPAPDVPDSHAQNNTAQIYFTRTPQEYESSQTLMVAPDGADIFFGFVRVSRTTAPTHTWYGQTIGPLQKESQWIPWIGSGIMEAACGLTRIMHLVIEGGNLVLVTEQSVGPACGGAEHEWGDYPASSIFTTTGDNEGGNFVVNTTAGFVVWTSTSSPYRKSSNRVIDTDGNPADFTTHQIGGSDPVTTTDPTAYRSVYSVDVKGYFGRRS